MSHNITIEGGTSVRLPTKGKYCDRDIVITATGGGTTPADPIIEPLAVTENGIYTAPSGVDGYSPITVNVEASGGEENQLDLYLQGSLSSFTTNATKIAGHIFRNVTMVKQINAPNCTSIGTYAFYYATSLNKFTAPKVTSLGTYAFYNSSVTEFNFPSASSIPSNCFNTVVELEKADFGVASSIAAAGFAYCENLTVLILRRSSAICSLANKNALVGTPIEDGTGYVYVPSALVEKYKTASNWSAYASQIRAIEDYPDICGN